MPYRTLLEKAGRNYAYIAAGLIVGGIGLWIGGGFPGAGGAAAILMLLLGGLFAILWSIERHSARRAMRILDRYERGECLVHWICSDDESRQSAALESQQLRSRSTGVAWLVFALLTVSATISGIALCSSHQVHTGILMLVLGPAVGAVAAALILLPARLYAARRAARLAAGGGEVYIGADGCFSGGEFLCWKSRYRELRDARFTATDPPRLAFTVHVSYGLFGLIVTLVGLAGGRYLPLNAGTDVSRQLIVPTGHEDEARALVGQLMSKQEMPKVAQ